MKIPHEEGHPKGELKTVDKDEGKEIIVDTFAGAVHVEWDPDATVTPLGQLPFFIQFLKLGNLWEPWIEECPLELKSGNAPSKEDVLGTLFLSILGGHKRYSHVTAIRSDAVTPELLGMKKVVSEDSLRRNIQKIEEREGIEWLQEHLHKCYGPLLEIPWILDVDTTIKVLYGNQEGAVVGYNPKKPGRPSHTYHTFSIANLRLILDVDVQGGNQTSSSYTAPELWSLLERIPKGQWPAFLRGDSNFGTDGVMSAAEEKGIPYLFKLRLTKNVKKLAEKLMKTGTWSVGGQGWEGQESSLKLQGWSKSRRVIVLRKPLLKSDKNFLGSSEKQLAFEFGGVLDKEAICYEYAVLVTTLKDEVLTIAQHYRDRADSENVFDELKNQWGWGGYTTQDLKRCRLTARSVGLIYNWWNLFVRLADPDKHLEAITSRPLLLHAIGKRISHAGQTRMKISSMHGKNKDVKKILSRISTFFKSLKKYAEHLTSEERWCIILSKALEKYLKGYILHPPGCTLKIA